MQQANVEIPRDYSVRVRSVRGCIELTQAALAKRIGVSFATVNRWENGQSRPTRLAWQQILDLEAEIATSEGGVEPAAPAEAPSTLDFPAKRSVRVAGTKATRRTGGRDFSPPFAADQSREHEAAIHVRGFADPIHNYKIVGAYDDLVEQGRVIREERDGLRILLDLERQDKAAAVEALESVLSQLRALPDAR